MGMVKLHKCPSCWDNPCTCNHVERVIYVTSATGKSEARKQPSDFQMSHSSNLTMALAKIKK